MAEETKGRLHVLQSDAGKSVAEAMTTLAKEAEADGATDVIVVWRSRGGVMVGGEWESDVVALGLLAIAQAEILYPPEE